YFPNLLPNTQYTFTAKARNAHGAETAEVAASTYTLAFAGLPVSFTGIWPSSITLSWNDGGNGPGATYQVQASTRSDFRSVAGTANASAAVGTLTGIAVPQTTYYFRVRAANAVGVWNDWAVLGSTWSAIQAPTAIVFDDISTHAITASAYAVVFSSSGLGLSGTRVVRDGSVDGGWHGESWTTRAALPVSRYLPAAAGLGGKVYLLGGNVSPSGAPPQATNYEYDPAANVWASRAAMPTARLSLAAVATGGRIHALGGSLTDSGSSPVANHESYDPVADAWTVRAPLPTARGSLAAVAIEGTIYAVGGLNGVALGTHEAYDPSGDAWTPRAPAPTAVSGPVGVELGGKGYFIAGTSNQEYDPGLDAWTARAPVPSPQMNMAGVAIGGKAFIVAGWDGSVGVALNREYDPSTNQWRERRAIAQARTGHAAAVAGGKGYFIAGWNTTQDNQLYDPGTAARFAGLAPNTLHSFAAKARNFHGSETAEITASTYTLAYASGPVSFTEIWPSSITLSWNDGGNGPGATYQVQASTRSDFLSVAGTANASAAAGTVTGIAVPQTTYYFRVRASNSAGVWNDWAVLGSTWSAIETPSAIVFDDISTHTITASAYAASFSRITLGLSGANVALGGAYAGWRAAGTWATRASMPTGRGALGAATLGGRIYAVGGGAPTAANEEYDPVANVWTTRAPMPTARTSVAAVALGGRLYLLGGSTGVASPLNEEYDPVTDTWAQRAAMPTARQGLGAAAIDGKLHAVGGFNGSRLTTHQVYDPATDAWTSKAAMPTARDSLAVAALGGKLHAVAGYDGSALAVHERYDPASDAWTTKAPLPAARYTVAGAALGGKMYVVGGTTGSAVGTHEEYDPAADAWTARPPMPAARAVAAAVEGGKLYALGGGGGVAAKNEAYDPGTSARFASLAPNALYAFAAKARNAQGAETGAISASTYTLAFAGLPISFAGIWPSSITLSWSDGGNGPGATYQVQASTRGDFLSVAGSANASGPSGTIPAIALGNRVYHLRVRAANAAAVWSDWTVLGSTYSLAAASGPAT
ncbi:MAG: fibronectin type III domain-containing protein, partial [Elusimicrobia bacterium]|nr:fibronectin type III domain-containing protein [Elusimicrobiota bacterium]